MYIFVTDCILNLNLLFISLTTINHNQHVRVFWLKHCTITNVFKIFCCHHKYLWNNSLGKVHLKSDSAHLHWHLQKSWFSNFRSLNLSNFTILAYKKIFLHCGSKFSRLNTLCTPLVWMKNAAVATLYTTSGYVIKCSVQNFVPGSNVTLLVCHMKFPAKVQKSMQCTKWSNQRGLSKSASRPQFCTFYTRIEVEKHYWTTLS